MRLSELQSVISRLARRVSGYLRCRSGTPFASSLSSFSSRPSPNPLRVGSFSRVRLSSSEYLCRSFRPSLSSRNHAARVSSLSATSPLGVHSRGRFHSPATFRPRVFSTPRRLTPPIGFAGLLHPAATPRVLSVQGFLPICSRPRLVVGSCPLTVVAPSLTGEPAATTEPLGFEALFRNSVRSSESTFDRPFGRSPLRFRSSCGSSPSTVSPVPRALRP